MTHHHIGLNTPRPPDLRQGIFDGKQRGLGISGLIDGVTRPQHIQERSIQVGREDVGAAVQPKPESRLRLVQMASHPGILRPLSREQKGDFWRLALCLTGKDTAAVAVIKKAG